MSLWVDDYQKKLLRPEELEDAVEGIKSRNRTIATLNGSFDLLHAGHLHIIYSASQTADCLIVALNTDASIQRYKSYDRPIIPLPFRLQMMAALEFVDFVTYFDETDPIKILSIIKPDIHVNGAEYGENCIEAETVKAYGGRVETVELVDGLSTSNIINKIASLKTHASSPHL